MNYNLHNADGRTLTYANFPEEYTWSSGADNTGSWHRRSGAGSIGRVYFVSPRHGDKYYLRLLLHHVKGATSWEDLRTVNGVLHPSFQEACVARGLLQDDAEWVRCLKEASDEAGAFMPWQLRSLFAVILNFNRPQKPAELWRLFKEPMMEDMIYRAKEGGNLNPNMVELENNALYEVELLLQQHGESLANFPGMPLPHPPRDVPQESEVVRRERNYDMVEQQTIAGRMRIMLSDEQAAVVHCILTALDQPANVPKCFFLYACGGCGKTFILRMLLAAVRGQGKIAKKGVSIHFRAFGYMWLRNLRFNSQSTFPLSCKTPPMPTVTKNIMCDIFLNSTEAPPPPPIPSFCCIFWKRTQISVNLRFGVWFSF